MFHSVLVCLLSFSLLHVSSSLVHGGIQLNDGPAAGRHADPLFLLHRDRNQALDAMHEPTPPHADSVEDSFMVDDDSYDELQGRAMRSLRRCIPHQQSCLGYPLPCCDPCDTCYCRFFNAICYCRQVGHNCSPRRT
ncbi:agouti-related protein precursor [Takifugu rubripes]|uniref:Agouti related protein 1 n=1 Tax=Takifugu rubripes TaxID=31033 RepID=A0ZSG6_TAKRU|nr:agouti-related protein precursor [Takifugu rubripes]BAF37115.1 agouti related protein 1 [Takifugu rubripes]|eukprot:NP_001092125.1 agouti related protein 1 precursor [Takifugu rubripes]